MTTYAQVGVTAGTFWVAVSVVFSLTAAVAVAGCGQVTVDQGVGDNRGSGGGSDAPDAATALACDLLKPFGTPVPAAAFNSDASDDGLSFSADGLTAYISSARGSGPNNFDLFKLTRATIDQPFGTATLLDGGVNTADQERDPRISRDGLRLYYFSNHVTANASDLFLSIRQNLSASFGAGSSLAAFNTTSNEYNPFLASDEQVLYFASDRPGGMGGADIYRAPLMSGGSLVAPSVVPEISTSASEYRPVVSDDGLTIYFDRVGAAADDIWIATRAVATAVFGAAHAVTELNGPGAEFPLWLSPDNCTLYFSSDRLAGSDGRTGWDIFQATRAP